MDENLLGEENETLETNEIQQIDYSESLETIISNQESIIEYYEDLSSYSLIIIGLLTFILFFKFLGK